jgi:hypothetical protein
MTDDRQALRGQLASRPDDKVYTSFEEALEDCFPHEAERRRRAIAPPKPWEREDELRMIVAPLGQENEVNRG